MIGRHIDLIAVALLLSAFAICAQTRNAVLTGIRSSRHVWFSTHYQHFRDLTPVIPRISFSRD